MLGRCFRELYRAGQDFGTPEGLHGLHFIVSFPLETHVRDGLRCLDDGFLADAFSMASNSKARVSFKLSHLAGSPPKLQPVRVWAHNWAQSASEKKDCFWRRPLPVLPRKNYFETPANARVV